MATIPNARGPTRSASPAVRRNFVAEIRREPAKRPPAIVLSAPPGFGKSSLVGNAPNAVMMPTRLEETWDALKSAKAVPSDLAVLPTPGSWSEVLGTMRSLLEEPHDFKVFGIDTISGCERLCHEYVCQTYYKNDWGEKGFQGYQRGAETSITDWREFLVALDKLRDERGMAVFLLGHLKIKNQRNPEGPDFDRYVVDVSPPTWQVTHKWADAVLFGNFHVEVDESGKKAKGKGGKQRFIYTEFDAAYDAKNRLGLPPDISMGDSGLEAWNNVYSALLAGRDAPKKMESE